MANGSFDVALGREVELYRRVLYDDPASASLTLVVLANAGLETDAELRQHATLSAVLAANDEVTNTGYSRIILYDTDLAAYTVDTTNHRIVLPLDDQIFPTISAGDAWRKVLICYDDNPSGGTDADIVPICYHDLLINGVAVVPNGNNIRVGFGSGILVAS